MKKTLIMAVIITACVMTMISCGEKKVEVSKPAEKAPAGVKIAFVNYDTLQNQYQYFKDCKDLLEKKMKSSQESLNSKQTALQNQAASYQQRLQNGGIKSQAEYESLQKTLAAKQAELEKLNQSLSEQFANEQEKYNKALHDSIDNFIKVYNKTAGYTYILTKSGDNILYADPACDITNDVVKGLNARYKKAKK